VARIVTLELESCGIECPHSNVVSHLTWCAHPDTINKAPVLESGRGRRVEAFCNFDQFPIWCPLPHSKTDIYGVTWDLPDNERCPVCGQPDSCGDCNHKRLQAKDIAYLKGEITEKEWTKEE
jgi:hypothetical protein